MVEQRTEKSLLTHFTPFLPIACTLTKPLILKAKTAFCPFSAGPQKVIKTDMKLAQQLAQTGKVLSPLVGKRHFPAARSRVVIRLAKGRKAKPNANTRTLRPDKCLVVSALFPRLRPGCPRNIGNNAATTRDGLRSSLTFNTGCQHHEIWVVCD